VSGEEPCNPEDYEVLPNLLCHFPSTTTCKFLYLSWWLWRWWRWGWCWWWWRRHRQRRCDDDDAGDDNVMIM